MDLREYCPACYMHLGTSLTSCACGWKMLDPMPRQDLELPPPVGFVPRAKHDRLIAEKDAELKARIAELEAEAEQRNEQIYDMIDASGQKCACGYDKPSDVCLWHLSHFRRLLDAAYERAAEVAECEGVYPELNVWNGGPDWYKHGRRIAAAIRAMKGPAE